MNDQVRGIVKEFFRRYPERHFVKRQVLVQAGQDPDGVFYVVSGRVSQYDISAGGSEVVVNVFNPLAFFPVSWAINKPSNQYFYEAATDVVARQAPAEDVVAFLKREPEVVFDLLSRVYRGADGMLRRLAHLMGGDAKSRLLFEIINASYRFGKKDESGSVLVPLTESDLAKYSGLARETVNRMIQGLKAAGLVEIKSSGLAVKSVARLEAMLGSDL